MSLLDMVDKVLAQKRELDAKSNGCFAFHLYTQGKAEHPKQPTDKKGDSCYSEARLVAQRLKRFKTVTESPTVDMTKLVEDCWVHFQERAAIAEYDGKMSRNDAERLSLADVIGKILHVEQARD